MALIIFLYAFILALGTFITAFLLIPLKAFLPVFLAVSFLDLIVMLFKLLQPLKAFLPILLIFAPIVSFVIFLLPLSALLAIDVTLNFLPPTLTVDGITTFLIFFFVPVNWTALVPLTEVTLYFVLLIVTFLPTFILEEEPPLSFDGCFVVSGVASGLSVVPGSAGFSDGAVVSVVPGAGLAVLSGVLVGSVPGVALGTGVAVDALLLPPGLYAGGITGFVVLPGAGVFVVLSVSSNVIT